MNHLAVNITSPTAQLMGCNDSMMAMSMIMRQPLGGVIVHVV